MTVRPLAGRHYICTLINWSVLRQLLSLELIMSGLNLCKCSCGLLGLACLILPHPLKNSKNNGVYLRWRWWWIYESITSTTMATASSSPCGHLFSNKCAKFRDFPIIESLQKIRNNAENFLDKIQIQQFSKTVITRVSEIQQRCTKIC